MGACRQTVLIGSDGARGLGTMFGPRGPCMLQQLPSDNWALIPGLIRFPLRLPAPARPAASRGLGSGTGTGTCNASFTAPPRSSSVTQGLSLGRATVPSVHTVVFAQNSNADANYNWPAPPGPGWPFVGNTPTALQPTLNTQPRTLQSSTHNHESQPSCPPPPPTPPIQIYMTSCHACSLSRYALSP